MTDFTPEEFNRAMAKLEGITLAPSDDTGRAFTIKTAEPDIQYFSRVNPYSDLNQLMPIAWKYDFFMDQNPDGTWVVIMQRGRGQDKNPVEAIRQCLWAIAQEQT